MPNGINPPYTHGSPAVSPGSYRSSGLQSRLHPARYLPVCLVLTPRPSLAANTPSMLVSKVRMVVINPSGLPCQALSPYMGASRPSPAVSGWPQAGPGTPRPLSCWQTWSRLTLLRHHCCLRRPRQLPGSCRTGRHKWRGNESRRLSGLPIRAR